MRFDGAAKDNNLYEELDLNDKNEKKEPYFHKSNT